MLGEQHAAGSGVRLYGKGCRNERREGAQDDKIPEEGAEKFSSHSFIDAVSQTDRANDGFAKRRASTLAQPHSPDARTAVYRHLATFRVACRWDTRGR